MANPTVRDVHVNRPLTQISIAFTQETPAVCDQVFPVIDVSKKSDEYFIYDQGDWNRIAVEERAPATESAGAGYRISTADFSCKSYALHKDIAWEERENADDPLDADADAVAFLNENMRLHREYVWANQFFKTGVWTGSSTGTDITVGGGVTTAWSSSSATPIDDISTQMLAMELKTGRKPNTLILGTTVWNKLKNHSEFLGRLSDTELKNVRKEHLAALLELDRIIVAGLAHNTAAEGQTKSMTRMFGDHALLLYVAPRPSKRMPSAGYTFRWRKNGLPGEFVRKFEITAKNADRIELQTYYVHKQVAPDMGVFFSEMV